MLDALEDSDFLGGGGGSVGGGGGKAPSAGLRTKAGLGRRGVRAGSMVGELLVGRLEPFCCIACIVTLAAVEYDPSGSIENNAKSHLQGRAARSTKARSPV